MFKLTICLLLVAVATGANGASVNLVAGNSGKLSSEVTTEKREIIPLLSFEVDKQTDGSFRFSYEGGDQSSRTETGTLTNAGTDDEALEVKGSYRYYDSDGQLVEVHYTAGKNGFVPIGTNIAPEISSLAKAAADLPEYTEEQERADRFNQRRARSKSEDEPVKTVVEAEPVKAVKTAVVSEPVVAASEVVPVEVVPVEKVKAVAVEQSDKVESKTA
ncbi:larval cuticle protein LCP-17 [Drosophila hydei]|uniref:Larval cuticle protein LCP-17 n=1 Tax=Drosophila hydei TaxID=7224 RepID=A0A6J1MDB3_DROHY|nr:larval cuticle protein LCP-17 [Drosophila hydei]